MLKSEDSMVRIFNYFNIFFIITLIIIDSIFALDFDFGLGTVGNFVTNTTVQTSISRNVRTANGQAIQATIYSTKLRLPDFVNPIIHSYQSGNGKFVILLHQNGEVRLWDFVSGGQQIVPIVNVGKISSIVPLSTGRRALIFYLSGKITLLDLSLGNEKDLGIENVQIKTTISPDNKHVASIDKNNILTLWNIKAINQIRGLNVISRKILTSIIIQKSENHTVNAISFSNDNRLLAIGDNHGYITVFNVDTGKQRWQLKQNSPISRLKFVKTTSPGYSIAVGSKTGVLNVWALRNSLNLIKLKIGKTAISSFGISRDNNYLAIGNIKGKITILNLNKSKEKKVSITTDHNNSIIFTLPVKGNKMVLTINNAGKVHLYDMHSGKVIVTGVSTKTGWAIIDSEGRFDGSEDALNDISWAVSDLTLNLNKFSKSYFEPGLLNKYLSENYTFRTRGLFNISQGIALPPTIEKFSFLNKNRKSDRMHQILVAAKDVGGKVEDIELFHNGKRVAPSFITLNRENSETKGISVRAIIYNVMPLSGENTFKAIGVGLGGIEGISNEISEIFFGPEAKTALHIVTIGIDKYQQKDLNLTYATKDANAMADQFKSGGSVFSNIIMSSSYDNKATKENVKNLLRRSVRNTKFADTLILYLAGHGIILDDEWFFLTHDLSGTSIENFKQAGISSSFIHNLLIDCPAQNIILLIDSCHSGKTVSMFEKFEMKKLYREVGKTVGIAVITATKANKYALETEELGHGIFTAVLLEGLAGKADLLSSDNNISVKELIDYSKYYLPAYSLLYSYEAQVPVFFSGGANFILGTY